MRIANKSYFVFINTVRLTVLMNKISETFCNFELIYFNKKLIFFCSNWIVF